MLFLINSGHQIAKIPCMQTSSCRCKLSQLAAGGDCATNDSTCYEIVCVCSHTTPYLRSSAQQLAARGRVRCGCCHRRQLATLSANLHMMMRLEHTLTRYQQQHSHREKKKMLESGHCTINCDSVSTHLGGRRGGVDRPTARHWVEATVVGCNK